MARNHKTGVKDGYILNFRSGLHHYTYTIKFFFKPGDSQHPIVQHKLTDLPGYIPAGGVARSSRIPSLCTHCTHSGIEWRR